MSSALQKFQRSRVNAKSHHAFKMAGVALLLAAASTQTWSADGCKVLLCLAAPKWRSINECVPPVQEVMRDLALGRPFPVCLMSSPDNNAAVSLADPPNFCPEQYTAWIGSDPPAYWCEYVGAITVTVNGSLFTRTWWNYSGDSVTDFSPSAKALLGTWDPRFDDEYAAWLAHQSPAPADPAGVAP